MRFVLVLFLAILLFHSCESGLVKSKSTSTAPESQDIPSQPAFIDSAQVFKSESMFLVLLANGESAIGETMKGREVQKEEYHYFKELVKEEETLFVAGKIPLSEVYSLVLVRRVAENYRLDAMLWNHELLHFSNRLELSVQTENQKLMSMFIYRPEKKFIRTRRIVQNEHDSSFIYLLKPYGFELLVKQKTDTSAIVNKRLSAAARGDYRQ